MKKYQRIGFVNVCTLHSISGSDISAAEAKFVSLSQQLKKKRVGLCGLAEVRWAGSGEGAFEAAPGWQVLYSGTKKGGKHGVALAMNEAWQGALLEHKFHNDRILSARFQGAAGVTISVVVAYSPTDCCPDPTARTRFYGHMQSVLASIPQRDIVFVLGDFNGQVGQQVGEWGAVRGQHSLQTCPAATENGRCLLELAAAHGLVLANTYFPHKRIHTYTFVPRGGNQPRRVIDYILASKRCRSSLRDCRVFSDVDVASDHRLLVLTAKLRLCTSSTPAAADDSLQRLPPARSLAQLRQPQQRAAFAEHMQNRFEVLANLPEGDVEHEWQQFVEGAREGVQAVFGDQPQQRRHSRQLQLSARSRQLVDGKHRAWQRVQQARTPEAAAEAKVEYRRLTNAARRAVAKDSNKYYERLAAKAEASLHSGHSKAHHMHIKRLFADRTAPRKGVADTGLREASGNAVRRGVTACMGVFTEQFESLLQQGGVVSDAAKQQMEAAVQGLEHAAGWLRNEVGPDGSEDTGEPPTVGEVQAAVRMLRNDAAAGVDGIVAPLLKAGSVMACWLHRVIVAVWNGGKAPLEWKRALIVPLYKGKGDRRAAGNYRGISLLSIPGKVYTSIIMQRVYQQADQHMGEWQTAFRRGRGLGDAVFTLRMVMSRCREFNQPVHMAFVDLQRAYDSVDRDMLWLALQWYGVHPKLQALLQDLHVGTQAAVKLGGFRAKEWFEVRTGVRQGCVIAPLLFNMFMDLVVRAAAAKMPDACGVRMAFRADGEVFSTGPGSGQDSTEWFLRLLLYADDLVLLSHDPQELVQMLQVLDATCREFGLTINASKTELMSMCPSVGPAVRVGDVQLSNGVAKCVEAFRYLGGMVDPCGTCEGELAARIGKALGKFKQMYGVWNNKRLKFRTKVRLYKCYVLPVLLFGSEFWALTQGQAQRLERAHSSCMRRLLHVRLVDQVPLSELRQRCRMPSLQQFLQARRLQWLGHVLRMQPARLARRALLSRPWLGQRRPGRPAMRWSEDCMKADLAARGLPLVRGGNGGLDELCSARNEWRRMVHAITHSAQG